MEGRLATLLIEDQSERKGRLLKAAGAEPLGRGELCGMLSCILSNHER